MPDAPLSVAPAVHTLTRRSPVVHTFVTDPAGRTSILGESAAVSPEQRFLTLADVAEVLNISVAQTYALVRQGELVAIKIGGRGQWRVEVDRLEEYIARMYDRTAQFVHDHPRATPADEDDDGDGGDAPSPD